MLFGPLFVQGPFVCHALDPMVLHFPGDSAAGAPQRLFINTDEPD